MLRSRFVAPTLLVSLVGAVAGTALGLVAPATAVDAPPASLLAGHALVADSNHASLHRGWWTLNVYSGMVELDETAPLAGSDGPSTTSTGTWFRQDPTGHFQKPHDRTRLALRRSGDLVLLTAAGKRLWHSRTAGSGAVRLTVHAGGGLALHTRSGTVVWRSHSGQEQLTGGMSLEPGEQLRDAWETAFKGGQVRTLTMQRDGNLVHRCGSRIDWQSRTHVRGSALRMSSTGLLRVVTPRGRTVWSSHSGGHDYAWLDSENMWIQADGIKLVWTAPLDDDACR